MFRVLVFYKVLKKNEELEKKAGAWQLEDGLSGE